MEKDSKIFVAGGSGLVGSSIYRRLRKLGYSNILSPTHSCLNLEDISLVWPFFRDEQPDFVFMAAAKVGGIIANRDYPVDFLLRNLRIQNNVLQSAHLSGVKKLVFLGSSCIYPKECFQPILESELLTGPLEQTNESYAIAKIAGIKLCEAYRSQYGRNYISLMPTNLYGPNDNFDLETSHVIPALIHRLHLAKISGDNVVEFMGTGKAKREFLYVDDLADATIFLMENYNDADPINIGSGYDLEIMELVKIIANIVGYVGDIKFSGEGPDGTPRKLLDSNKLYKLGWGPETGLEEGLKKTYEWFLQEGEI